MVVVVVNDVKQGSEFVKRGSILKDILTKNRHPALKNILI